MTTQTIKKMVDNLSQEVVILRSLIISVAGRDSEGFYKPEFVKSVLKSAKNKPTAEFKNAKDFLNQIKKA